MSSAVTGKGVPVKVPNRSIRLSVLRLVRMAVAFVVVAGSLGLATVTATAQSGGSSCPSDGAAAYSDVPESSFAYDDSRCLRELGISDAGDTYRPGDDMTRSEMAAFMANAYEALTGEEAPIADHAFTDIADDPNADDIARISPNGLAITTGTTDTTYSPDDPVIRAHMALFLTRLYERVAGSEAPAADTEFTDIAERNAEQQAAIGQLLGLGVTTGTTPTTYSPTNNVTREQMASFVARMYRALDALPDPTEAPGAPTGVEVAISGEDGDALDVSWTAPEESGTSDVTGYVVQWKSGDDDYSADNQSSVDDTSASVADLTQGDTYTFRVAAVSDDGRGDWSDEASGNPAVAPGLVGDLKSVPGNSTLALSWTAPEDDGGSEITGYLVSWRTGRQSSADTADVAGDATGYTITGLDNTKNYSVWVQAINAAGTGDSASVPGGDSSVAVTPVPTKSTAPQNLSVTSGTDGETLNVAWTAAADDGGTVLIDYSVEYRCVTADGNTGWITTGLPASGQIPNVPTRQVQVTQIGTLTAGNACEVRVRANSYDDKNDNDSQDESGTPPEPTLNSPPAEGSGTPVTLPGVPTTPAVNPAHQSLQVTWGEPASDGGSDVTGYKITWDAGIKSDATVPAEPRSYIITGLNNSYQYAISITAITAVGESANSADVAASEDTQPRAVSAAPTNVRASLAPLALPNGDPNPVAGTSLVVTWSAPPANGTEAVAGYVVQQRTSAIPDNPATPADDPTTAGEWANVTLTDDDDIAKRTVVAAGLTAGDSYDFQVRATNDHDDDSDTDMVGGLWSAPASGTPSALPGLVTVAASGIIGGHQSLTITWGAPDDDGGNDVTSYIVKYASQMGNSPFRTTTVQAPLTRVTLTGLGNGVATLVQIQAVNARGAGSVLDQQSTTVADDQGVVGTPTPRAAAPTSVTAAPKADGDGTRITVSWNAVTRINAQGPVASYVVETNSDGTWIAATAHGADGAELTTIPATLTSVDIVSALTGDGDGIKYQVRVRAQSTLSVEGSWGYITGTVTSAGTPAAPDNVEVDAADERAVASTVTVTWDSVTEAQSATSEITGYVVSWHNPDNLVGGDRGSVRINGNTVGTYSIVGLSPGTYSVTVASVNHVGDGAPSTAVEAVVPRPS